jgi:Co/Zn/Cd efflux system component
MTIRAELSSDTIASVVASTIAVNIGSPILALTRKLLDAGFPSSAELEAYRGETLSLRGSARLVKRQAWQSTPVAPDSDGHLRRIQPRW